ncbi:hypothetical protein ACE38W_16615 [Chitinophaga sp. Hz27]|uniref:hypothetical protein n=1 Tax=Chitinophaga sp. Hz27 TaxID=3347169 RepID=UPI0035D5F56E
MNNVTLLIENLKEEYTEHPFFLALKDPNRTITEKLSFLPEMAYFIMSFGDLNKYILPYANPIDDLQEAVTIHAKEDEAHWPWYLMDLEELGFNKEVKLTTFLKDVWSEKYASSRRLLYELIELTTGQSAAVKLAVIEMIEATGSVFFTSVYALLERERPEYTTKLLYLGDHHLSRETGHTMGSDDFLLENLSFNADEFAVAEERIRKTYAAFRRFMDQYVAN